MARYCDCGRAISIHTRRRGVRHSMKDHDLCGPCWRTISAQQAVAQIGASLIEEWGLSRRGEWHRVIANHLYFMDTRCGLDHLEMVRAEKVDPRTRRYSQLNRCQRCKSLG